jgi:hypothetical protein
MNSSDRLQRFTAAIFLASAWLWHAARAVLSAVTTDEAFTALDFAGKPWLEMLAYYDANNHVLHTVLVKLSLDAFGWNAVALRLPALLAGLLYSVMIWRLGRRWFGASLPMVAFCAAAAWAAPVAEYFSLARGYAMALAFFSWALVEAEDAGTAHWTRVSFALGLSVASNLVFVIPAAALCAEILLRTRAWRQIRLLAAPGGVTALIVLALPLSRAEPAHFYYGARSWTESLSSILEWPGLPNVSQSLAVALPLLALAALTRESSRPIAIVALLSTGIVSIMAAAGVAWPRGRTGVYLSLLFLLAALRWVLHWPRLSWLTLLLAPASWFALPLRTHPEWTADASSRTVVEQIAARERSARPVIIAAEFPLNYAIAFHAREILGDRAKVVRLELPGPPPDYRVSQGNPPEGAPSLFQDPATRVTLSTAGSRLR